MMINDPKSRCQELVTFKEMRLSEVITSEAIINLLDRKGIISKQELMEDMKQVQASVVKAEKLNILKFSNRFDFAGRRLLH